MAVSLTLDNRYLAETYDEISDSQFDNGVALIEKLDIRRGDKVLDIGCGTGRLGRYVLEIIGPSGEYIGLDPLEERIHIANEKNVHLKAVFGIGSAEELWAVPDNSIDVVYLNAVFHWVIDKITALREIVRVLKPGGKVGITTGAKELNTIFGVSVVTENVLNREPYSGLVRIEESTQHRHGLTTTELIRLLSGAGLKVKEVQVRTIKRVHATARDLIRHSEASSFGNYLNHVPESLRERAKADIEAELEKLRTEEGIRSERHTIFAVAGKERNLTLVH